jgi:hypothetical protein
MKTFEIRTASLGAKVSRVPHAYYMHRPFRPF